MTRTVDVDFAEATLTLLPERAIWWEAERSLLLADVHLGKDQVFRRHGIAIPDGPTERDLRRIDGLLAQRQVDRLIVLGDLVHAGPRADDRWTHTVATWRQGHPDLAVDVVLGNHDRGTARWLERWDMGAYEALRLGKLDLVHEREDAVGPCLCGHVHPVTKLRDGGHTALRLPVFHFTPDIGTLPAFGAFTGGHVVRPGRKDRTFVIAGEHVVQLGIAGSTSDSD
ncbi:MAG: ligase-associated DNA damage response endonuclease PdeM [Pseudomonadota bacterium]